MTGAKGDIWFPCNFSSWITCWEIPKGCTLPSGMHSVSYENLLVLLHAHPIAALLPVCDGQEELYVENCSAEGHGDYRDTLPSRTEDVAEQLASIVEVWQDIQMEARPRLPHCMVQSQGWGS